MNPKKCSSIILLFLFVSFFVSCTQQQAVDSEQGRYLSEPAADTDGLNKILVYYDMEGISGITKSAQVSRGDPEYQHGRQYMAWDTNACVDGCFNGGAKQVVVRDAHGGGFNMLWDQIDPRAELIPGTGGRDQGRLFDVGQFDAMILLGYQI